jgi:hypothetical protein
MAYVLPPQFEVSRCGTRSIVLTRKTFFTPGVDRGLASANALKKDFPQEALSLFEQPGTI